MKQSYVFLAEGFEEIEALATVDILRRAGMPTITVAVGADRLVRGANGIVAQADMLLEEANLDEAEWLIAPGGMPGAENLRKCAPLCDAFVRQAVRGGRVAAICAAPAVLLASLGLLEGKRATCYPGFEAMCMAAGATMENEAVVEDGNIITGQAPGAAYKFAYAIVAASKGAQTAADVKAGMLYE